MLYSHLPISPPFSKENQLCNDLDVLGSNGQNDGSKLSSVSLPGQPCIQLASGTRVGDFLNEEFWAQDLETMAPKLWIMTTPSSANINPLHRQKIKGREIVVTEEPRLHLVWNHDRIFIKPIPKYLMSYAFWNEFLIQESSILGFRRVAIKQAALGYLRTYVYLIRHQSDFTIAQEGHLRLIPEGIDWTEWAHFIAEVSTITDANVSSRYQYGELRLTRLNSYAKFLLHQFHYERVHGQYGDYFARLYGPFLFIFAIISTILNAMQVELAAEQVLNVPSIPLGSISSSVSRLSLVGAAFVGLCFILLWLWIFLDEWIYTLKAKPWRKFARHG